MQISIIRLNNVYMDNKYKFRYIDLFAGIGGFHQAMSSAGGKCVFASEIDKNARASYEANYKADSPWLFADGYKYFNEDINNIKDPGKEIPDFDVVCGGFPCQPFSIAGLRKGFTDTRGTLFFNIANIVNAKKAEGHAPKVLLLENVKGLKNHDKGKTLKVILETLDELGYNVDFRVLNAKYFGVPQNRERLFIVCWDKKQIDVDKFEFPYGLNNDLQPIFDKDEAKENCIKTHVSDIFEPKRLLLPKYTISDRMWEGHQRRKERNKANGKGFGYSLFTDDSIYCSTISARYWKDGSEILIAQPGKNPRKLTPVEAGRLQGYKIIGNGWENKECENNQNNNSSNQEFKIVVSEKEAFRQFGNSVAVPVVKTLAKEIVKQLLKK